MHFSIPDTAEINDAKGSYTVFNIHINGVYHCSVRYSQLHDFQLQLKKEFKSADLPAFPPKKLLMLSPSQLDERRMELERYIQLVSQVAPIASSTTFNSFLLNAQQESQHEAEESVSLDVYLANGHKISVDIQSTDRTDQVLEAVTAKIELPESLVYYFGLFLVNKESSDDGSIVRKLQEFESPYISLKASSVHGTHWIMLRKTYWESILDDDLLADRVAMNLIYVQAVHDIERGWVLATKEQKSRLEVLQQRNSKKDFLQFVRTLKYYGYIVFKPCTTDYPMPETQVVMSAGNRELNFRFFQKDVEREVAFKVTRMRCWRISSLLPDVDEQGDSKTSPSSSRLELAFEYLVAKNTLKWITLFSSQAILISMCLQGMVDELIMRRDGRSIKRPRNRSQAMKDGEGGGRRSSSGGQTSVKPLNPPVAERVNGVTTTIVTTVNTVPPSAPQRGLQKAPAGAAGAPTNHFAVATGGNSAFDGINDDDL